MKEEEWISENKKEIIKKYSNRTELSREMVKNTL